MLQAICVLAAVVLQLVSAMPEFQQRIPNGDRVLDPCKDDGSIWYAVGHFPPPDGWEEMGHVRVILNPFGVDFKKANYTWTTDLCEKDSDGDGKPNGEELGDPDCSWVCEADQCEGMQDMQHEERDPENGEDENVSEEPSTPITHPGFCEPVTSTACKRKNKSLNAKNCEALAV